MRRREFIAAITDSAAAWPLAARAQQAAMPVIGYLSSLPSSYVASRMPPFRQGLGESGYIEGQNVEIQYRSAEGQYNRLPQLAADLVDRKVAAAQKVRFWHKADIPITVNDVSFRG